MISNQKAIQAKLTGLFVKVEPKFRSDTIARYVDVANTNFALWIATLTGPEPPRDQHYHDAVRCPDYVTWDGGIGSSWQAKVEASKRGEFRADVAKATRDANASVDNAKLHFISKHTKKITNATTHRTDRPTIAGTLRYRVVVQGTLTFTYKNGDSFEVVMSMIVNHRYTRGYTSFYQFPARFTNVKLAGEVVTARMSERWMAENFKVPQ